MDLSGFIEDAQQRLQREYERIQARRTTDKLGRSRLEDPGTAGDQGEENWAHLLREWLPSYFQVATKGRILFADGSTSPQVDVIVLSPAYPKFLVDERSKYYLASGVAAAFECKLTGSLAHIDSAFETVALLAEKTRRIGPVSPHAEANGIPFGLLCHSFKTDEESVKSRLQEQLRATASPRKLVDFVCLANMGCWNAWKSIRLTEFQGQPVGVFGQYPTPFEQGINPVGRFLTALYYRLASDFKDMRAVAWELSRHTAGTDTFRFFQTGEQRVWTLEECFTSKVVEGLKQGRAKVSSLFSHWGTTLTHLF